MASVPWHQCPEGQQSWVSRAEIIMNCAGNPKAKTSIELTPMQPLQLAVDTALASLGLSQSTQCSLLHSGKALDLSQPYRFAGLPASAALVLDTGMLARFLKHCTFVSCLAQALAGEGPKLGLDARVAHSGAPAADPASSSAQLPVSAGGASQPHASESQPAAPAGRALQEPAAPALQAERHPAAAAPSEAPSTAAELAAAQSAPGGRLAGNGAQLAAPAAASIGSQAADAPLRESEGQTSAEPGPSQTQAQPAPPPPERPYKVFSRTELQQQEAAQSRSGPCHT